MGPNPQFPADLVTFTVEIGNGKLRFLCSVHCVKYARIPPFFDPHFLVQTQKLRFCSYTARRGSPKTRKHIGKTFP